ncbi:MAG: adenylate/guanylate cyclase domain-containing protein [Bradyrhizobium sp.]
MGIDEVGTARTLREHRRVTDALVAKHGGRLVKTTGDGVLLEFPSVVDAVECALAMQAAMAQRNEGIPQDRRMLLRIGINLGDILIEDDDILGDGVNVAARLEGIAEPGGICVSDDVYRQVVGKVSAQFVDDGEQQLKNISRRVRICRVLPQGAANKIRPQLTVPDKPSIAVLPFDNMSEVSDDIYFADGIAEDIIAELSRYPDLFIVARNSSFTYRGKAVRVGDVARELGVRYVLEGSVRRSGNRVRVNAQLIDATNGNHLWAQRFDRNLEDLFSVQDEVTQSIVAVLPERVQAAAFEAASRKTSNSLDAYDHLLRGKYCHHLETLEANSEAEAHFDRSIDLDPRFASAFAWKACTLGQAWNNEFRPRTPELFQEMIQLVEHAASLDENDTECHRIMCRIALIQAKYAKSDYHLERALVLNPNDPRLVVQRGINLTFLGNPAAAIPWIETAMRLDPFSAHRYYLDLVRALFMDRRPAEAVAVLERTTREHWEHYLWAAASNAALNEKAAALEAAQGAIMLRPQLSIASYVDGRFKWKRSEDRARLREALARAGLPE